MKFLLLLFAGAIGLALFLNWSRRSRASDDRRDFPSIDSAAGSGDVRGMRLVPGRKACVEAIRRSGEIMPPDSAMALPLPGCTRDQCDCRLSPVPGRRREQRREQADRRESVRFGPDESDRRSGRDRRQGGKDPWSVGDRKN